MENQNNKKQHILEISVVLTALIIFTSFTDLPSSLGYSLLLTVPVGSVPSGIAYDPSSTNIYVANFGANTVSVINPTTNAVTYIPVGTGPISTTAGNGNIYVANFIGNSVSVISSATNSVIATVPVGANPTGIAFDPSGKIYVSSYTTSSVYVISSATNAVIATVPVGAFPYGIAVGNGNVYVASFAGNTVSVISDSTNTVTATVPVGANPTGIAFDPHGNIYVSSFGENSVYVISSATNSVTTTVPVGANPFGVTVDKSGNVYVANFAGNTVSVISDSTNTVTNTITGLTNPSWIAYSAANGNIYVIDMTLNSVSIISSSTTPSSITFGYSTATTVPTGTTLDTTPPVFTPVSDIAVFPTGLSGAVVTYTVTAKDDTGTPTITCDHQSGTMFSIATTPVTCTATDSDSTGNQATIKFNVKVYTPIEGAGVMVNQLNALNYLSTGTINSLDAKLPFSITMIPGGSGDAKFKLYNFVNEVNSKCCSDTGLTSKPFTSAQANMFITEANDIAAATP